MNQCQQFNQHNETINFLEIEYLKAKQFLLKLLSAYLRWSMHITFNQMQRIQNYFDIKLQMNHSQVLQTNILDSEYKLTDNTNFYHRHILSNIKALQIRRDRYLNNRLQFLEEYLQPIQQKIDQIKKQRKYYEEMRDTQNQVIENQSDIVRLKQQIKQYTSTKKYFVEKLDEYEKCSTLIVADIEKAKKDIQMKRLKVMAIGNANNFTRKNKSSISNSASLFIGSQRTSKLFLDKSDQGLNQQSDQEAEKILKLPKITTPVHKPSKYYIFSRQNKYRTLLDEKQSISLLQHNKSQINPQNINNDQNQKIYSPAQINKLLKQFNKTQSLFHECFERKKVTIQKLVTQLQSKLITNKDTFLRVCQAIGNGSSVNGQNTQKMGQSSQYETRALRIRKQDRIQYEQFRQLTPDQLITIFISFGWLNRRVYSQFNQKRKRILQQSGSAKTNYFKI